MKRMIDRKHWLPRIALAVVIATTAAAGIVHAADDNDVKDRELERKLEDARSRLEQAAREVADLSQQLSGSAMDHVFVGQMFPGGRRAILGINLGSRGESKVDGVYVTGVSPGGPAEQAGLRSGDVIHAMDGKKLMTGTDSNPNAELLRRMREVKPGDKVKLEYLRNGKKFTADVTTRGSGGLAFNMRGDEGGDFDMSVPPIPPIPPIPPVPPEAPFFNFPLMDERLGDMELVTLTPKLGSYFGTDKGALVIRAPSADLKLEEGDVITAIDGRQPQSGTHALRILRSYQPGEKVKVSIMRARKAQTLEVTLPDRPRTGNRRYPVAPRIEAAPAAAPAPAAPPAPQPQGGADRP
jgi:predicted metalloprotease with PDZ domain